MLRGVWGFRDGQPPAGDRVLQIRRHVPSITVIVDAADRIDRAFAVVAGHGLVTSELTGDWSPRPRVEWAVGAERTDQST